MASTMDDMEKNWYSSVFLRVAIIVYMLQFWLYRCQGEADAFRDPWQEQDCTLSSLQRQRCWLGRDEKEVESFSSVYSQVNLHSIEHTRSRNLNGVQWDGRKEAHQENFIHATLLEWDRICHFSCWGVSFTGINLCEVTTQRLSISYSRSARRISYST